jgi:hypothetical protein
MGPWNFFTSEGFGCCTRSPIIPAPSPSLRKQARHCTHPLIIILIVNLCEIVNELIGDLVPF